MARTAALVAILVGLAMSTAAGGDTAGGGEQSVRLTTLTITYWPDERRPHQLRRWTLRCNPVGGTLPGRAGACSRLARPRPEAFSPVPRSAICTEIYGGPQLAVVKGVLSGGRLRASFRRRNGCEIKRWSRFSPWLLPPPGLLRQGATPCLLPVSA